ncbi:MAG: phosphatase PAP2 family protein [Planctomycetota bacterium]
MSETPTIPPLNLRTHVVLPLAIAVVLGGAAIALDAPVRTAFTSIQTGGDIRRELEVLQQFGSVTTLGICAVVIGLLDAPRLRRMLDWILAAVIGSLVLNAIKVLTGRIRPSFGEPLDFYGPLTVATWKDESYRAIDFAHEVMAMPSTHTSHAVIAAVFLSVVYPPLRWLVWPWAAVVGICRVYFNAHWPSDVIVGACLGFIIGSVVIRRLWGVRLLDWIWVRFVDRSAKPAWPRYVEASSAVSSSV